MNQPPPPEGSYQAWPEQRYPVAFDVEPQTTGRNRLTVAFRLILAIPHLIIVGGPFLSGGGNQQSDDGAAIVIGLIAAVLATGLLTIAVGLTSIISWFAILITGAHPRGMWKFARFFMRWNVNVAVYTSLLRDEYPPFGEGEYPVQYEVEQPEKRVRWTVFLRIILAIPHLIVLFFLGIAWFVTVVIAWFAILFTGNYPEGLYKFGIGVLRWQTRVESYLYLLRDEYPPFSLDP
jgi:hypothetical protein